MLHNIDQDKLERYILYGMVSNLSFVEQTISAEISKEHFLDLVNKSFFASVISYHEAYKALLTREVLERKLRYQKVSEQDIINHLIVFDGVKESETSEHNFSYYLSELKKEHHDKELRKALKESGDDIFAGADTYAVREKLLNSLNSISLSEKEAKIQTIDIKNSSEEVRKELNDRRDHPEKFWGVLTNLTDFDRPIQGCVPGRMLVLAGEPGGYKSTLGINIAYRTAKYAKAPTLLISLEMKYIDILFKILSLEARISTRKLFDGHIEDVEKQIDKTLDLWKKMDDGLLRIVDVAQMGRTPVSKILTEIHKAHLQFKPKVVIVDYLSLMGPDIPNPKRPDLELGEIAKSLRGAARKYNFNLIILCQIKRDAIERLKKQSQKAGSIVMGGEDLAGSQEIANDADAIYFLLYDRADNTKLRVFIGKNRWGPTGEFKLMINKDESYVGDNGAEPSADNKHEKVDSAQVQAWMDSNMGINEGDAIDQADKQLQLQTESSVEPVKTPEPVKKEDEPVKVSEPVKTEDVQVKNNNISETQKALGANLDFL